MQVIYLQHSVAHMRAVRTSLPYSSMKNHPFSDCNLVSAWCNKHPAESWELPRVVKMAKRRFFDLEQGASRLKTSGMLLMHSSEQREFEEYAT